MVQWVKSLAWLFSGNCGEESISKLTQVVGKFNFLLMTGVPVSSLRVSGGLLSF